MRLPIPTPPQILLTTILTLSLTEALAVALPAGSSSKIASRKAVSLEHGGAENALAGGQVWSTEQRRHGGEHHHEEGDGVEEAAETTSEDDLSDWEKELAQMGHGHGGMGENVAVHEHEHEHEHGHSHHANEGEADDMNAGENPVAVEEPHKHPPHDHGHDNGAAHDHPSGSVAPLAATPHPSSPGHHHHSHGAPKQELDEASILQWHGSTPLSFAYYDWFLSADEQLYFTRTGLSAYGNATKEMSGLNKTELEIWQDFELRQHGRAEGGRVMGGDGEGHKWLMVIHIAMMMLGYWGILPIVLALRAAKYRGVAALAGKMLFGVVVVLGWLSGVAYKRATPNLYRGHSHNINGNILLLATLAIFSLDLAIVWKRLARFWRSEKKSATCFTDIVLRDRSSLDHGEADAYERVRLASDAILEDIPEDDESDEAETKRQGRQYSGSRVLFTAPWATKQNEQELRDYEAQAPDDGYSRSRNSSGSDRTLRGSGSSSPVGEEDNGNPFNKSIETRAGGDEDAASEQVGKPKSTAKVLRSFGKYLVHFLSRGLVVWAYIVSGTGLVVYTGLGRGGYLPSLLAHTIKGSIFFWYGLLTFARYLGAFAEYGWAWNAKPPHKRRSWVPSAEFLESAVIWFYGITNTWMERIGAAPGSPYTLHNIQHISIAILFWGAGFMGMALESKAVRDLLGFSATRGRANVAQPRSYSFSFNPFPALTILVLGISMSTHSQDYVFQVSIHVIWGYLLAAFSIFRLLTYFFLWLAPPSDSILPSRPPTEAVGSFCLAAGGIVFVLSDEEVAYAAMRSGYADGMMFTNVTCAIVGGVFSWVLAVLAVKGWAMRRRIIAQRIRA